MTPANPTPDPGARSGPAIGLPRDREPGPLPWAARPRTVTEPSPPLALPRLPGPIGAWRVWRTGTEPAFALSALPRAMLRAEPARVPWSPGTGPQRAASLAGAASRSGPAHGGVAIRPALCLCASRTLTASATPFAPAEIRAAIGSTHPAALVLTPAQEDEATADSAAEARSSRGCTDLIFGPAMPGVPAPGMAELRLSSWRGWKLSRTMQTVPVPDFIAPLTWLVNDGLAKHEASGPGAASGGLLVGQMVVFDLPPDEIRIDIGIWTKLVIGDFGMIEFSLDPAGTYLGEDDHENS